MALEVTVPFDTYYDTSGAPLDNGYIYIGTENLNPETNPISIYWDDAMTIPAANPARTINGYPSRNGTPARIYCASLYSITVKDKNSALVYSSLANNRNEYSKSEIDIIVSKANKVIGTIAILRTTLSTETDNIVSVTGYYTAADNIGVREYYWDATSTEADNGGTIIQVTGVVTGRWKMKYDGAVNIKWFGATNGSDVFPIWRTFIDVISDTTGKGIVDGVDYYTASNGLEIHRSNLTLSFDKSFIKLIAPTSSGGVLTVIDRVGKSIVDNVTIINPLIDGGNLGYVILEPYGENGIAGAKCTNVKVIGGTVKNCKRGTNPIGSGGKAIQFETGVDSITVIGTHIEDCSIALETQGIVDNITGILYDDFRRNTNILYADITAVNCDRLIVTSQTSSPPNTSVDVCSVNINNVIAKNCGLESYGTATAYGPILMDRASNVSIKNITLHNDSAYGAIRAPITTYSGNNNSVELNFNGDCDTLVSHDLLAGFGSTGTLKNYNFSVSHNGLLDYFVYAGIANSLSYSQYTISASNPAIGFMNANVAKTTVQGKFFSTETGKTSDGRFDLLFSKWSNTYSLFTDTKVSTSALNDIYFSSAAGAAVIGSSSDLNVNITRNFTNKIVLKANTLNFNGIPTAATGLVSGDIWNNAGVLTIV